jgi:hypothetical protein
MPEKPNPCNLKLVILPVEEDDSCCVWSHNLSAEDATRNWSSCETKVSSPLPSINARVTRRNTQMTARCVARNSLAHARKTYRDEDWKPANPKNQR